MSDAPPAPSASSGCRTKNAWRAIREWRALCTRVTHTYSNEHTLRLHERARIDFVAGGSWTSGWGPPRQVPWPRHGPPSWSAEYLCV